MAQHGKKYRNARAQIDREQAYSPLEAIRMLKEFEGPTFVRFGSLEPLSSRSASLIRTAAGGVFVMKSKLRSS